MQDRSANLNHIRANPDVSVLIIGGGVNGIGTFLDLALQGVDVYLAERSDFASGATAASSHMAHGGIRYLENGEFSLVREAVGERNRMLMNAPHIVSPLPTVIPIFKVFSGLFNAPLKFLGVLDRPAERGLLVIKVGLMMYDAFTGTSGARAVPRHKVYGSEKTHRLFPRLNPDVQYTAVYYDGHIQQPERYCVEMIRDAEAHNDQVRAVNYLTADSAEGDTVTLRDTVSGDTITVRPQVVINAAGPWIDFVNAHLGLDTDIIGGTKGSHLVLHHPELHDATEGREFFFENYDGRIVLCFPFGPERVLVGTTDIRIDDPDEAVCSDEEIDYILGMLGKVFPDIEVTPEHVQFTYCGVRPLPSQDANTTGQISRDHQIDLLEGDRTGFGFPILSLVGGKWTSYRAFSEETADRVLDRLNGRRRTDTRSFAIGGGKNYPQSDAEKQRFVDRIARETGISAERAGYLFRHYGTKAGDVAAYIAEGSDEPLRDNPQYSRREIMWVVANEKVVHLDDLLLRRTMLPMWGRMSRALLEDLAGITGEVLGWDESTQAEEVERTLRILREKHRVVIEAQDSELLLA